MTAALTFTACPDSSCDDPASVEPVAVLASTHGDVLHVRVVCLHRKHTFVMPADRL